MRSDGLLAEPVHGSAEVAREGLQIGEIDASAPVEVECRAEFPVAGVHPIAPGERDEHRGA